MLMMAPKKMYSDEFEGSPTNRSLPENPFEYPGFIDNPQSLNLDPTLGVAQFNYENPLARFYDPAEDEPVQGPNFGYYAMDENPSLPAASTGPSQYSEQSSSMETFSVSQSFNSHSMLDLQQRSPQRDLHSPPDVSQGSPLHNYQVPPPANVDLESEPEQSHQVQNAGHSESSPKQELSIPPGPYGQYPDLTTMINSNSDIVAPIVEARFENKGCPICKKTNTKDMSRHWRIHQAVKRFACPFPRHRCDHKTGQFNRRYDFKKHLLNKHYIFDDRSVKRNHNLSDKLDHKGTCLCGKRFWASDWIDKHVLTDKKEDQCPLLSPDGLESRKTSF